MTSNIKIKKIDKDISSIIIDEPQTYNLLSFKNLSDLLKNLKKLDADKNVKVIILEGAGKGFSAGHNLKEVRGLKKKEKYQKLFNLCSKVMLQIVDNLWKEHLATMDHLRQGIHLRGYAQKNPKQEYKREAFELFQELLENMKRESIRILSHVKVRQEEDVREIEEQRRAQSEAQAQQAEVQGRQERPGVLQDDDERERPGQEGVDAAHRRQQPHRHEADPQGGRGALPEAGRLLPGPLRRFSRPSCARPFG